VQRNLTLSRLARARACEALPALLRASADVSSRERACTRAEAAAIRSNRSRKDDEHIEQPNGPRKRLTSASGVSRVQRQRSVPSHHSHESSRMAAMYRQAAAFPFRVYPCTINIEALLYARIYAREYVHAECGEQGVYCARALAAGPAGKPRFLSRRPRDGKKESPGFAAIRSADLLLSALAALADIKIKWRTFASANAFANSNA